MEMAGNKKRYLTGFAIRNADCVAGCREAFCEAREGRTETGKVYVIQIGG